jgi:hypothetical protein
VQQLHLVLLKKPAGIRTKNSRTLHSLQKRSCLFMPLAACMPALSTG